jgi:hypothetical protein
MFGKLLVSTVGDMCRMLLCVMRSAIKILWMLYNIGKFHTFDAHMIWT